MRVLAIIFSVVTVAYSGIWMYCVRWQHLVNPGIAWIPGTADHIILSAVNPGSVADSAGLRAGDEILAINNRKLSTSAIPRELIYAKPGGQVSFLVKHRGEAAPFTVTIPLKAFSTPRRRGWAEEAVEEILNSYPMLFLVVGIAVLWLRFDDRNAWLLAIMFAGFIAAAPIAVFEDLIPLWLRGFALAYMLAAYSLLPAVFNYFFATFPTRSPIDRRFPWLKSWLLVAAAAAFLPVATVVLIQGSLAPAIGVAHLLPGKMARIAQSVYFLGGWILGLASLLWNSVSAQDRDARRKTRVMVWGTVASVAPMLLVSLTGAIMGRFFLDFSFWVWAPCVMALFLLPLSFAYAVVKHRVLEIPLLLRRSARYVLVQRGFVVLLFVVAGSAIILFTQTFSRLVKADSNIGMGASAVFGILLVWVWSPVIRRGTERIDKAFFRSAYDARVILHDLGEKTRNVTGRHQLASLLERHIEDALHPQTLICYFEASDSMLVAEGSDAPPELKTLSASFPLLAELAGRGKSWDWAVPLVNHAADYAMLAPLAPECLVPILGRNSRLVGLLVLGQRLSEEPYSREDKRLLESVASQAGIALENIRLAEKMAERMEAERRAAQELEIARQVQAKLLPQKSPELATLDYAGKCIQARAVGGDYYDFLDLGSGRVGFVLADIVGKGISAALLMANLQAHLRSLSAVLADDFITALQSVNRLFYQSTEPSTYATLFIGLYDDRARSLRYINCGHHPPLLVRSNSVERLASTATILGMFENWCCEAAETSVAPGDLLTIYTDGVLEAMNPAHEEFGEGALIQSLQQNRIRGASIVLEEVISAVQRFSAGEQSDDLTLVVARGR